MLVALRTTLQPDWIIEREVDPSGDPSIIVFPTAADSSDLSFILYEANGLTYVGMVRDETWENDEAFETCQQAVEYVVAAVRCRSPDAAVADW